MRMCFLANQGRISRRPTLRNGAEATPRRVTPEGVLLTEDPLEETSNGKSETADKEHGATGYEDTVSRCRLGRSHEGRGDSHE